MKHIKLKTITLKDHKAVNEAWIHEQIKNDPAILGLGNLLLKDHERIHEGKGRLDLLLQEDGSHARYEVEIQLGATDPSHIIRTIEYWDLERKRYPQYEHTAVIVAEDITSRFLNVISLFNGSIPIIALQMTAVEQPDGIGIFFTKILDTMQRGFVDEDEETSLPADRSYWQERGSTKTLNMADEILKMCSGFTPNIELNYNKAYIGFKVDGSSFNFASCKPRKTNLLLTLKLLESAEINTELEAKGIDFLDYDKRWKQIRIRLSPVDLEKNADFIQGLLKKAFDSKNQD
jgi:predicted transport protein